MKTSELLLLAALLILSFVCIDRGAQISDLEHIKKAQAQENHELKMRHIADSTVMAEQRKYVLPINAAKIDSVRNKINPEG